jgi:hypothetical protein
MTPKTTDVLSFFIDLCRAPELSGKLVISNTAMVLNPVEFEWELALPCGVALSFSYKAALKGIFRTAYFKIIFV